MALVGDETSKARTAFMVAAAWPDIIRIDPRFYDDIAGDVQPTPLLPGFPDMKSSSDRTKLEAIETPNALTELLRLIAKVGGSVTGANPVYDLPWLVHIASDVHNPVHCATRFSKALPKGDFIGTRVFTSQGGSRQIRDTGKLGEGGMGEVWRVRDEQLHRNVALKILPSEFARDPARRAPCRWAGWVTRNTSSSALKSARIILDPGVAFLGMHAVTRFVRSAPKVFLTKTCLCPPTTKWLLSEVPGGRQFALYPIDGGEPKPVPGIDPKKEYTTGWRSDNQSIYVIANTASQPEFIVDSLNVFTGKRERFMEVHLSRPVAEVEHLDFTPDGRAYAYNYNVRLSDLYVASGLREPGLQRASA